LIFFPETHCILKGGLPAVLNTGLGYSLDRTLAATRASAAGNESISQACVEWLHAYSCWICSSKGANSSAT